MKEVTENELLEQILKIYQLLSSAEFVEETNKILGTNYTVDDIDWDNNADG